MSWNGEEPSRLSQEEWLLFHRRGDDWRLETVKLLNGSQSSERSQPPALSPIGLAPFHEAPVTSDPLNKDGFTFHRWLSVGERETVHLLIRNHNVIHHLPSHHLKKQQQQHRNGKCLMKTNLFFSWHFLMMLNEVLPSSRFGMAGISGCGMVEALPRRLSFLHISCEYRFCSP